MKKRQNLRKAEQSKKAQIMGMPIQIIFSLFIIAVFLVVAFFIIKNFLDLQNCSETGLFSRELQDKIDEVWRAEASNQIFSGKLPSGVEYVCFGDLSKNRNLLGLNSSDRNAASMIYDDLRVFYKFTKANMFLYPRSSACGNPYYNLNHLNITSSANPLCFRNIDGRVRINLVKDFTDALVRLKKE